MKAEQSPQSVRFVEIFSGEVREVPFNDLPQNDRWAFLREGKLVNSPEEADEIVPIVEVRRLTLDAQGDLVPSESAVSVRIEEFGPGGRPVKWTLMVRRREKL